MRDRDYYPAGAYDDPNAPYNQPADNDPIEVVCDTCITLRKDIVVETTNYWVEYDEEGYNETHLEDGCRDLAKLVKEQATPLTKMLDELAKYIKGELAGADISKSRKRELEQMLEDCQGWSQDLIEVDDYECND